MSVRNHDLALRMAELAQVISLRRVDDVLVDVTAAAKELIAGVDIAGVLLVGKGGTHQTLAPTSDVMFKLDELQMTTGEGPCLQAALDEIVIRTDDFRDEPRFPNYAPKVVELGLLSALSLKLYTADRTAGALNLVRAQAVEQRSGDDRHGACGTCGFSNLGQPRKRTAAVGAVDPRPHRPGQGHHHGAVRGGRCAGLRDAAPAVAGQQHAADRGGPAGHRYPRRIICALKD